nr:MAG: hypothetical protein [Bacteriophage sp.]
MNKLKDIFDNQKAGLVANLEIAVNGARSWKVLLDIKSLYHDITGEDLDDFDKVLDAADKVRSMYERTLDAVKGMSFDDMALLDGDGDFENPINEIIEFEDPESWIDVFEQALMHHTASLAGSGIEQIRARLISEAEEEAKDLFPVE